MNKTVQIILIVISLSGAFICGWYSKPTTKPITIKDTILIPGKLYIDTVKISSSKYITMPAEVIRDSSQPNSYTALCDSTFNLDSCSTLNLKAKFNYPDNTFNFILKSNICRITEKQTDTMKIYIEPEKIIPKWYEKFNIGLGVGIDRSLKGNVMLGFYYKLY